MKVLIVVLKGLVIIALCADLLLWLAVHGSGHKIPSKTDWSFGITSILLLIVLLVLFFIRRKK
jgi:hypothetical protein